MRCVSLVLGLLALCGAWLLPLGHILPGPFSAHMTMHMAVVAVAAPLLALGIAGTRLDPVRKAPGLFPPIPASIVELLAVWAWHAPVLHHIARHSMLGFVFEQATFLFSGLFVWLAVFGGEGRELSRRRGSGILALLLTSMHMTLLGALLALPPRPLYADHVHAVESSRLTALEDQHLGGAIMLLVGGISYLSGGLWLTLGLVRALQARRTGVLQTETREGL